MNELSKHLKNRSLRKEMLTKKFREDEELARGVFGELAENLLDRGVSAVMICDVALYLGLELHRSCADSVEEADEAFSDHLEGFICENLPNSPIDLKLNDV